MTASPPQRLLLPFARQRLLGGYKTALCLRLYGYLHTGLDIASAGRDRRVHASGSGIVVAAGHDSLYGWGVAVLYRSCESVTGERCDLIARYMHLSAAAVRTGDPIQTGDIIGREGSCGTGERHLHLELDAELSCPCRSPQVGAGHSFWLAGADTTVDPALWLFCGPEQVLSAAPCNPAWLGFAAAQLLARSCPNEKALL